MNYRSVTAFGKAVPVTDDVEKEQALGAFVDHIIPGRNAQVPPGSCSRDGRSGHACNISNLGDERHMLLTCPALGNCEETFLQLITDCSSVIARLVWAKDQPV